MSTSRTSHARARVLGLSILIATACVPTFARQPVHQNAAFEEATGRSLLSYPVDSGVDITNIKLEITIADMNAPRLEATETLDFKPLGWPADEIRLRSQGLKINSVRSVGREVEFAESDRSLTISFRPPVPVGVSATVVISYVVTDPTEHQAWTTESPAPATRPALLNTSLLETWYPRTLTDDCSTSEVTIDVPLGYLACAPGRLVSRSKATSRSASAGASSANVGPREVFRWAQDAQAGGDLCGRLDLVVGKFDVVDVGTSSTPVPVYAPIGRGPDARAAFAIASKMTDVFSARFSADYPWAKFAPIVVRRVHPGGADIAFENTPSMAFFTEDTLSRASTPRNGDHDIARALAQQWFGGLLSARSPEHVWLEQGFSTYAISLWLESTKTIGGQADADDSLVRAWFDSATASSIVPRKDLPDSPLTPALVSKAYTPNSSKMERSADPGTKGAAILHMLRQRLGDEVFFKGLAVYINRFAHRKAETIDFRHAMEEVSGESLEQFFDQWCFRPGVPVLDIKTQWKADTSELMIDVTQTQEINADNPAFAFALPIVVPNGTPMGRVALFEVNSRTASISISLESAPEFVTIDPAMSVLSLMTIAQPESAWIAQLARGQTWNARAQAVRSLSTVNSSAARAALTETRDSPSTPESLKAEIGRALRQHGETETAK